MSQDNTPVLGQPVVLKPAAGLKIRKEDGTWLPEQGDTVTFSSYYARRLGDGDVELVAEKSKVKGQ